MLDNTVENMQSAVSLKPKQTFREAFAADRPLPPGISFLNTLSKNFYWSWHEECAQLFRNVDPALWDECEQNPRLFLQRVKEIRLWQKESDETYLPALQGAEKRFREYMDVPKTNIEGIPAESPVAYFCAEYGIHNSLPIYSGGLGILAGDHLKSASDMNVPLVAVGLMYRYGYFRQKLAHDGWQEEKYNDCFESEMALEPVKDADGGQLELQLLIRGREVRVRVWLARVGRISLYLLDTNLPSNDPVDQYITGHLYGGDTETRVVQETVLGIGGLRLLKKLGIKPSVFHLNEGHSAFLTLELASERLASDRSLSFLDAMNWVRERCVFTTHTPVDAGNDAFEPELIERCFDDEFVRSLGISFDELLELGRADPDEDGQLFGMTPLAIRMCRSTNGVSEKHGEVSRNLWLKMFPEGTRPESVPITSVTNGVHPATWIDPVLKSIYKTGIGPDWERLVNDGQGWEAALASLSDEKLWNAHTIAKSLLVSFVRERTLKKKTGKKSTIHEHQRTEDLLDPNALTIGFARRIAAYKRWNLLMHDLERLLAMVDDPERPVQFVFAGKAHPQDRKAKNILQELMTINQGSNWQRRAVFIDDYDQEIARHMVRGVDVWMNVPRRPLEASGTSGQKAAMNGVLNFSILDGWWLEGFNGENGFSIGPREDPVGMDQEALDKMDAESLYETLESEIIPMFYDADESGLPSRWIAMMRHSISTLTPAFSSDRMLNDYIRKIYLK